MIVQGTVELDGEFAFRHECVGEVIDVGDAVRSVSSGDLVSVLFQVSCGTCTAWEQAPEAAAEHESKLVVSRAS